VSRKNNSLSIRAIEGDLLPEQETYQARLRDAIFDGVSEADVADIVKQITAKAKAGDPQATKLFFNFILGNQKKVVVNNHFGSTEDAARVAKLLRSNAG
jgi:hypothetical protein